MSAQETARRIMNGHLDKEARDKTEESMGIMTKEYLKHKYLEKTGEDDKEVGCFNLRYRKFEYFDILGC